MIVAIVAPLVSAVFLLALAIGFHLGRMRGDAIAATEKAVAEELWQSLCDTRADHLSMQHQAWDAEERAGRQGRVW